jgi:ammonium transporter, Amt family
MAEEEIALTMEGLQAQITDMQTSIDLFFVLVMGIICFMLQAGFGLLEVGSIRAKNAQNILLKNMIDAAVTAIAYYLFGYSIAYGTYVATSGQELVYSKHHIVFDVDHDDSTYR